MSLKPITPLDLHGKVTQAQLSPAKKEKIIRAVNELLSENAEEAMSSKGLDFASEKVGSEFEILRKLFGDDWLITHYLFHDPALPPETPPVEHVVFKQKR